MELYVLQCDVFLPRIGLQATLLCNEVTGVLLVKPSDQLPDFFFNIGTSHIVFFFSWIL